MPSPSRHHPAPAPPPPPEGLRHPRWLTVVLSALLISMAVLTVLATVSLRDHARELAEPRLNSDFLVSYQIATELNMLIDAARSVQAREGGTGELMLRLQLLASLIEPVPTAPRAYTQLLDSLPQARELIEQLARLVMPWLARLQTAVQEQADREVAQDILGEAAMLRTLSDRLVSLVHRQQGNIQDQNRLRLHGGFYKLEWTIAGLITGSIVLSVWLLILNHQSRQFGAKLAQANARLESAVAQRTHELAWLANTDPLTELKNRRAFMEAGEALVIQCRRYPYPLSALLIDIDHFKSINDRYGHHLGDTAIRRVADAMTATLRETDVTGRLGGEEFAVLMPHTDLNAALRAAERLRLAAADLRIPVPGQEPINLTISIGVADFRHDMSLDILVMHADLALYRAKHDGRNRVRAFGTELSSPGDAA
ncbi:GGDEF domain-containing protein [Orrella sp. JC864]|uniref:GGDEF domain-containing protein n=1 Tax=Orrella sp. JC864 TaxID=3120298 RepID=UPI00300987AC